MKKIHIKITFVEPLLGTAPNNPEIYDEFIASKAPDAEKREEEVARLGADAVAEKSMTVFLRDTDGNPIIWNHHIKGFFKEACGHLQRMKGEALAKHSAKLKAYKKVIDGCIEPIGSNDLTREIRLDMPEGAEIKLFQRPIRGRTAQGERIALTSSEMIPAGTTATFYVLCPDEYESAVCEWLTYGRLHGLNQWRSAGFGRFTYEVLDVESITSIIHLSDG